jgi:hypothetical protein
MDSNFIERGYATIANIGASITSVAFKEWRQTSGDKRNSPARTTITGKLILSRAPIQGWEESR